MTTTSDSPAGQVTAGRPGPELPPPCGPISATMQEALRGAEPGPASPAAADADPFGADLQLALYLAYELHYRGFAGVDDAREWDLAVLGLRAALESRFLRALHDALGADAGTDGAADVASAVAGLLVADAENGAAGFLARHGTREQVREMLVHRSLYHLKEADPQAFVLPRLDGAAKTAVAAVEFDEYGGGRPDRLHSRLFATMMADLDLDPRYGAYLALVPAPMLAVVNFMSLCGLHRARRGALLGQLAAVEITSPPGAAIMLAAVRRHSRDAAAQEFYAEHVVADSVHEQVMRGALTDLLADEPQLAADVVFGIRAAGLLDRRLDEHVLTAWRAGETSLLGPLP